MTIATASHTPDGRARAFAPDVFAVDHAAFADAATTGVAVALVDRTLATLIAADRMVPAVATVVDHTAADRAGSVIDHVAFLVPASFCRR
ncbi:MAG TPA: hypothetical protein VEB18_00960 [Candidatus Paceibacterota bacterium]|nr:hypothetical protein [Candidatus Paceibacterota bacterium]